MSGGDELEALRREVIALRREMAQVLAIVKRLPPAQTDAVAEAQRRRLTGYDHAEREALFAQLTGEQVPTSLSAVTHPTDDATTVAT